MISANQNFRRSSNLDDFSRIFNADVERTVRNANALALRRSSYGSPFGQNRRNNFEAERANADALLRANSLRETVEQGNYTANLIDKTQAMNKAQAGYDKLIQIQNENMARTGQRGKAFGSEVAMAGNLAQTAQDVGNINYDRVKSMDMARSAEEHRVQSGNLARESNQIAARGLLSKYAYSDKPQPQFRAFPRTTRTIHKVFGGGNYDSLPSSRSNRSTISVSGSQRSTGEGWVPNRVQWGGGLGGIVKHYF